MALWRRAHWYRVAVAPGALFMLVFVVRAGLRPGGGYRFTLFDDSMISMSYGRTLARDGELVWFTDADRVQGITNPLWTLLMALVHAVGVDGSNASLAMTLVGALLVLAAAALVFAIVWDALVGVEARRLVAVSAAAAIPLLYPFVFWTLRGMEVGLLGVAVLTMVYSLGPGGARRLGATSTAVAAAAGVVGVLTRLDFAVLVGAVALAAAARESTVAARLGRLIAIALPAVMACLAVVAAQKWYYGDWLPNTYYLKVAGASPVERLTRGLVTAGKLLPVVLVVGVGMVGLRRANHPAHRDVAGLAAAALAGGVGYSIWAGGDVWELSLMANRYVSAVLPLAVVVTALAIAQYAHEGVPEGVWRLLAILPVAALGGGLVSNPHRIRPAYAVALVAVVAVVCAAMAVVLRSPRHRRRFVPAAIVGVVAFTSAIPALSWVRDGGLHVADDQTKTDDALTIAAVLGPDAVIATEWAGAPGYHSERAMVDLLGKSDRHVARVDMIGDFVPGHNKWDYDYSIGELRPDVLLFGGTGDGPGSARLAEWGYQRRCVDGERRHVVVAHVLVASDHVDHDALRRC